MILTPLQQRLIRDWWFAARKGRQLTFLWSRDAGMTALRQRMEEIAAANPQLFPSFR